MTGRKLFTPSASPSKQATLDEMSYTVRTVTRGSKRKAEAEAAAASLKPSSHDDAAPARKRPARSASPPPTRPSDFVQVTHTPFIERTRTAVPGAYYEPSFIPRRTAKEWYDDLLALPQWYRPMLKLYGREIVQSRAIIAFSKVPHLKLKYSGTDVQMHPWPDVLSEMEQRCREVVGHEVRFNHAMLNYYPSGETHIGRHSDNLENKVILTVSLGSPRTWIMTKRPPHGAKAAAKRSGKALPKTESHRWTLDNGSLLVMQGDVQKDWYHEIPKQAKIKDGRISITFRQLVYDD